MQPLAPVTPELSSGQRRAPPSGTRGRGGSVPVEAWVRVGVRDVQHLPRPRHLTGNALLDGEPAHTEDRAGV